MKRDLVTTATIVLTIVGTAIALAAVIVPGQRAMRQEMNDVRQEMNSVRQEINDVRLEVNDVRQEIGDVRRDISDLRERMARLEGLFDGFTKAAPSRQPKQI